MRSKPLNIIMLIVGAYLAFFSHRRNKKNKGLKIIGGLVLLLVGIIGICKDYNMSERMGTARNSLTKSIRDASLIPGNSPIPSFAGDSETRKAQIRNANRGVGARLRLGNAKFNGPVGAYA